MPAKTSKSNTPQASGSKVTNQNQRPHKRWYPSLAENTDQHLQNAMRFTWDSLYQLRESVASVASAAGVANAISGPQTSTAQQVSLAQQSNVAGSSGSTGGGTSSSASGTYGTGPSNSQILGLNVQATPPSGGQFPVYNSATGQIEFMDATDNGIVEWITTVPAHANSAGTQGTIAFDPTGSDTHLYICISTNSWYRVGISNSF